MSDMDPKRKRRSVVEFEFATGRLWKWLSRLVVLGNSRLLVIERRGWLVLQVSLTLAVIVATVFVFVAWRIGLAMLILGFILGLRARITRQTY